MTESKHYCATCGTHFRVDPDRHVEIEHDGGICQIVENGSWRDFEGRA